MVVLEVDGSGSYMRNIRFLVVKTVV